METIESAKIAIKFFLKILSRLEKYDGRLPALEGEIDAFYVTFMQTASILGESFIISNKGVRPAKEDGENEAAIRLAISTDGARVKLSAEARRIKNDVLFIAKKISEMRRHLAVGRTDAAGYVVSSLERRRSGPSQKAPDDANERFLRRLSYILGDVENKNNALIKRSTETLDKFTRFSPNAERRIKKIMAYGKSKQA